MNVLNKIKKIILVLLILIIVCVLVVVKFRLNSLESIKNDEEIIGENEIDIEKEEVEEKEEIVKVSVDVKGAVNKPGVYELDSNKKVIDVINLAGGLRDDADTSLINLAKKVIDEMVVVIYTSSEIKEASKNKDNEIIKKIDGTCNCPNITNDACLYQKDTTIDNDNSTKKDSDSTDSNNNKKTVDNDNSSLNTNVKVNINTATISELQALSGVGESKAQAIVEYREANGNFKNIEDIKNVKGIGDSVFEKIKDFITV